MLVIRVDHSTENRLYKGQVQPAFLQLVHEQGTLRSNINVFASPLLKEHFSRAVQNIYAS